MPIAPSFRSQIAASDARSFADAPWWEVYNEPSLQALIGQSLQHNNDLAVAVARIEQARGLLGVTRSEFFPQVGYEIAGGRQQSVFPEQDDIGSLTYNGIGGVLNAAWELDIWGRIRRSSESAQARLLGQEYARRGVMLTLVSDVAAGYFRLLRLDRELAIAQESSTVYRDTTSLFRVRFEAGRDSRLPMDRAQAAYDSSTARIADLRRLITQQENALSVLTGAYPRDIARGRPLAAQSMPQAPTGLTSDLLRRRPDILRAEQVMVSANAEIGVAIANYFTRIGLSALGGTQSFDADNGINGDFGVWNILGNVAGPIFTGGRLEGAYHARRAFWDESIASYKQTVLVAFQETSDALIAQQALGERRAAQERQVQALRRSVDNALIRYRAGRAGYFEVLEAEQQLFPAEDALAQTLEAQLAASINLYKALGGGWNMSPEQWSRAS